MPKRIKMLTSKWHRKEENCFTHHFRSHKCIQFIEFQFFLVVSNREGGGGILDYVPFWGPGNLDWTKLVQCTTRSCSLQNKTIIRPLRHIIEFLKFLTKSPCGAPGGPDWTKIAHAQRDHGTNNMRP